MLHIEAIVHGNVQGVGYRYYALHSAHVYGVTGWVKNMLDGTVKVVAEGTHDAIQQFVDALRSGPMLANVHTITTHTSSVLEHFQNFKVV